MGRLHDELATVVEQTPQLAAAHGNMRRGNAFQLFVLGLDDHPSEGEVIQTPALVTFDVHFVSEAIHDPLELGREQLGGRGVHDAPKSAFAVFVTAFASNIYACMPLVIEFGDQLKGRRNGLVEQTVHDSPFSAFAVLSGTFSAEIGENDVVGDAFEIGIGRLDQGSAS